MQVQVRHVAAELAGRGEADHRVHVRAVDVHLAAVRVDDLADLAHVLLEHAVRRRIRDHDRREIVRMRVGLRLQVGDVDVALRVARDHHDLHAGHVRRRRVRAVRGRRNQADIAVAFAARFVIRMDDEQARVLALRAGVRLQRHGRVARCRDEHLLELVDHLAIADGLLGGRERVDPAEFGPRDGQHFGGRVQLHRARAERDHRAVEREILVRQAAQVAQHFRFRMVAVEHVVRQVRARALEARRQRGRGEEPGVERVDVGRRRARGLREDREQIGEIGARRRFVDRHADSRVARAAQVDAFRLRERMELRGARAGVDRQRVEERVVDGCVAEMPDARGEERRDAVHAQRDRLQAARAVVDRVHARHDREQRLRGADVRRCLLAADVLLARLQREAQRGLALRVDGHADEAARHLPLEFVAHRHVCGVRAAEAHRHAEALRVADGDVRAPFAGRHEHGEREDVGRDDDVAARGVDRVGERAVVAHVAVRARILQQHAERVRGGGVGGRARLHFDADRLRARLDHFERLRQHVVGDVEHVRLRLADALQQRHRFGCGRGFVEQRRVGDLEARQVGDHLLEVQQRLEAALRDFGLVRRVRGVPRRVFEHVAQDHRRGVGVVVALADVRAEHLVLVRERAQRGERFGFALRLRERAERQRFGAADRRGDHGVDQCGARREAERVEHGLLAGGVGADMAFGERVVRFERGEREGRAVHQAVRVFELHGGPVSTRVSALALTLVPCFAVDQS
ncbi:hypothetical protein X979_6101 [Burkholderia pseudomallei MSHR7527]|nr:hypothetical protein X979_6101 [Burkholderia pseudomallei MSHR7527]